jgi:hypothetical protein
MRTAFRIALSASVLMVSAPTLAEGSAKEFLKYIDQGHSEVLEVLDGYEAGFSWANARLHSKKQPRLYCQPMTHAHQPQEVVEILRTYLKAHPEKSGVPAGGALLMAMEEKYPCQGAG